ncbi:hypothetical protein [Candidatus Pantoea soli]|uniref:DUF4056 domain-containing protein n=1 Tax=Candidatus Pantoea soli TaxID=3098669 RepID=A0A518X903_9GAMM|nr:hypothetical protein [Pantoea soli]QDY40680.1 hypothetical protein D8B20_01610 [Pantoea soli]
MSKRSDIVEGSRAAGLRTGLIYTEVLGWIDLGHARGDDILRLWQNINAGEASGESTYDITYSQSMADGKTGLRLGKFIRWRIRKGRSYFERQSIALAMMLTLAEKFERFQGAFPTSAITDSGFSGEDLVSDLLGFYRVMSCMNPFPLLKPVSKKEALKRWDHYGAIGRWKNKNFKPLLFPDPDRFPDAKPYTGHLPGFMKTISPYRDWKSGNVGIATADGNFIRFDRKIML